MGEKVPISENREAQRPEIRDSLGYIWTEGSLVFFQIYPLCASLPGRPKSYPGSPRGETESTTGWGVAWSEKMEQREASEG